MLILSGNYIGFLPPHYAEAWVAPGLLRRLAPHRYRTLLGFQLITRRGTRVTRVVQALIDHLLRAAQGGKAARE